LLALANNLEASPPVLTFPGFWKNGEHEIFKGADPVALVKGFAIEAVDHPGEDVVCEDMNAVARVGLA
jgi:hypothetical protein